LANAALALAYFGEDIGAMTLPDKPSIAVLPFQNMSGDPEQEYFVDGMVEEIITALSRIPWLLVIARNSSFTYKGQAVDVKQVGRELWSRRSRAIRVTVRHLPGPRTAVFGLWGTAEARIRQQTASDVPTRARGLRRSEVSICSIAMSGWPAQFLRELLMALVDRALALNPSDLYLRAYATTLSSTKQVPEALRLLFWEEVWVLPGY
jgi:adenylate cyclase